MNNIPVSNLDLLFSPSIECGTIDYNGKKMDAVEVLLAFMEKRIDRVGTWSVLCFNIQLHSVTSVVTEQVGFRLLYFIGH